MYRVVICDDEATSLQINQILTEQVLDEAGIEYEIATFDDMRKMTAALSDEKAEYDVLLCDILAVGMNGIEAAKELRRLGEKLPIIFISSTAEFALEGYSVNALRYLQKPIDIEKLREALMEAHQNSEDGEALKFQVADRFYKISFSDIEYLESCGRDTDIVTKDERISVHMKFSDMEKKLPADMFLRCHRSYIINLAQVKDLARYRFLTKNGVEIPVSQLQYNETKRRFVKFQ